MEAKSAREWLADEYERDGADIKARNLRDDSTELLAADIRSIRAIDQAIASTERRVRAEMLDTFRGVLESEWIDATQIERMLKALSSADRGRGEG